MQSTLFYLLQVVICSGVLFGYYLVALRNKRFHQYNRYYILAILLLSWFIPLIRIPVFSNGSKVSASTGVPQKVWEVIADNNSSFEAFVHSSTNSVKANNFNYVQLTNTVYIIIVTALLLILLFNTWRLLYLRRNCKEVQVKNGVILIHTLHPKAPFSFFNWIFWNDEMDIHSEIGSRILQHEIVHVQQKHSLDTILAYIVTTVGWFNPVFWLCRKELGMIHEFIADEKSANEDAAALAQMLLAVSFPKSTFPLAHSFFQSPIKRRLLVISFNPKPSYLRRLFVVPILAVVVILVAFRKDLTGFSTVNPTDTIYPAKSDVYITDVKLERVPANSSKIIISDVKLENIETRPLKKDYIVMIDAGHGGHDRGSVSASGVDEAEITFQLMQEMKRQSTNSHIRFVFSRTGDEYVDPQTKVAKLDEFKVDIVISLHANFSLNVRQKGIEILVPKSDTLINYNSSRQLANAMALMIANFNGNVSISSRIGTYLLTAAKRPAIFIEAGYLSNPTEAAKMQTKPYHEKLVGAILKGLEIYFENVEGN
jgi:N-acetylmuramoyl-L-alanine amidase